jgi:hypothetical protein
MVVLACGAFGFLAGWGRGPGLLLGAIILGTYDAVRHDRIPPLGYVLMSAGLLAVAALFYVVPLLRSN